MGKLYTIQIEVTTDAPAELVLAEAKQAVEFLAEELQTHGHDVDDENIDVVVTSGACNWF